MNQEKYNELCELINSESMDAWYSKTYQIFKGQKISNEDDFIRLVAFAYSWMPTIPGWRCGLNWKACEKALTKLESRESEALKEILQLIVPSINNSIVGASKVLHFAFPDQVPIIDSNVVIGWRALFFPTGVRGQNNGDVAALPSDFGAYGSDDKKREKHIDLYIKYSKNLTEWSNTLNEVSINEVSIRDIETRLYLLGKRMSDDVKKAHEAN